MIPLTLIAIATGIALLLVFRRFSDQRAISFAKRQIWAQLYALRLYADEPSAVWQIQHRLFAWNLRYLFQMLRPIAIVIVPLSALLFLLDGFYGHRALRNGESVLVSVHSNSDFPLTAPHVSIETPALRIPTAHLTYWRIRASDGPGTLVSGTHREIVHIGTGFAYISACAHCLGNPINIQYPPAHLDLFSYHIPWLVFFSVVTVLAMFAFRRRFGATF